MEGWCEIKLHEIGNISARIASRPLFRKQHVLKVEYAWDASKREDSLRGGVVESDIAEGGIVF